MYLARLTNRNIISTAEYDFTSDIFCIDPNCSAKVIFVEKSVDRAAHFRTTGKGESIHSEECGFFKELDFKEKLSLVSAYQEENIAQNVREHSIRLNLNKLDPDYVPREAPNGSSNPKEATEIDKDTIKEPSSTPQSISSLKTIKKLFNSVEPDLLASIILNVKGQKVPLSQIIREPHQAHELLWSDKDLPIQYFIFGHVTKIINRDKVKFINLNTEGIERPFTLVIFDKYLKYFELNDADLLHKDILACGFLKKNNYGDKEGTELIIKSSKFVEVF